MATTSTHFVHVDREQHLEQFVKEKISEIVSSFKHNGKYHLDIWISKARAESDFRSAIFSVRHVSKLMEGKARSQ
jgi:DNA topoisomerase IA